MMSEVSHSRGDTYKMHKNVAKYKLYNIIKYFFNKRTVN